MSHRKLLGAVLGIAVVAAACGSSSGSSGTSGGSKSGSSTTSTTRKSNGATSPTLQVETTTIGKVVADSKGLTLYLYVPDGTGTVSKVPAALLAAWPPVQATQPLTFGPGLTAKAGTATQPNGQRWVTYNGHLLYSFTGDEAPGDVNGNALGDVWYAVTPSGEPVQS